MTAMTDSEISANARRHYDEYPFDFALHRDGGSEVWQSAPFQRFVARHLAPGQRILDAGCGPGRGLTYLEDAGLSAVGCDISEHSLHLAAQRVRHPRLVGGSCLHLPFADSSFDALICDGVLHHTGDSRKGFLELERVLKPGGIMYIAVYKRWRYYYYLYRYLGAPVRALSRSRLGQVVLSSSLLPLYHLVQLLKSGGRRTWTGSKNLFYDYFVSPQATFHTRREVMHWAAGAGLRAVTYDRFPRGNCHVFVFHK